MSLADSGMMGVSFASAGTVQASITPLDTTPTDTIGVMTEVSSDMTFISALRGAVTSDGSFIGSEDPLTTLGRAYLDAWSDGYILEQAAAKIDAGTSTTLEQTNFSSIAAAAAEYSQPSEFLGVAYLSGMIPTPSLTLPLNMPAIASFIATNEQANPGASTAISDLNTSAGLFMQDYRSNLASGMSETNAVTTAVNHAFAMSPGA